MLEPLLVSIPVLSLLAVALLWPSIERKRAKERAELERIHGKPRKSAHLAALLNFIPGLGILYLEGPRRALREALVFLGLFSTGMILDWYWKGIHWDTTLRFIATLMVVSAVNGEREADRLWKLQTMVSDDSAHNPEGIAHNAELS